MKLKIALFIAILSVFLMGARQAEAHEGHSHGTTTKPTLVAEEVVDQEAAAIKTSPISALFRNLFKKNLEEKRENLEKNRDIRNKLVEERVQLEQGAQATEKSELNIKFNQKKAEIREQHAETVLVQFIVSIENLENIRDRIESRIEKFEDGSQDVSEAKDLTLLATAKLEKAKLSLYDASTTTPDVLFTIQGTSTATTTVTVTKKELLNAVVEDIKIARELLIEAIESLSRKMEI